MNDPLPHYDVCIVGSGPAGGILAVELAQKGLQILVIEAGTEIPDYDLSEMTDEIQVSGETDLRFGFSRQLGGASNLWAGRLAPLDDIDFQYRPWVADSGWPFPASELSDYYQKALRLLGVQKEDFSGAQLPQMFQGMEHSIPKKFLWAKTPFNAGGHIKEAMKKLPNLTLMTGWRASRLDKDPNSQKISSLQILHDHETAKTIEARYFVVAAGGLETPRLLMLSGDAAGEGADNVGCYLSTHPKANMAILKLNQRVHAEDHSLFTDVSTHSENNVRLGLAFTNNFQEEHRLLNHYVQLTPMLEHHATKLFEKIKGAKALQSKFVDSSAMVRGLLPSIGVFLYTLIGRLGKLQTKTRMFVLRAFLDQHPHKDNRVVLSSQKDSYGIPKISIRWSFTDKDKNATLAFFDHLAAAVKKSGIGHIEYSGLKNMKDWPLIGMHSHFMGTTRMGKDPATSVTDQNGKVHGIENLYVSGPSLFPSYGYANPVLTIAALSLRLADNISARFR